MSVSPEVLYVVAVLYARSSDVIDLHSSVPDAGVGASCRRYE